MNINELKKIFHEKLAELNSLHEEKKINDETFKTLWVEIDAILGNNSTAVILEHLYWYLRKLKALYDAKTINDEILSKLMISRETLEKVL
jgi:hypothetical protein